MIKMYKTDETNNTLNELSNLEINTWINVINPSSEEIVKLAESLNIDKNYLIKIIDEEEQSRIDIKNDIQTIIIDVPIKVKNKNYLMSVTTSLVIMQIRNEYILTISTKETEIFDEFINNNVPTFSTGKKSRFTFQIMYKVALKYIRDLKTINIEINNAENYLKKSTQNKDLLKLMHLRKSLVYFSTSLKSNELVLDRIRMNDLITLYEEDQNVLENVIIENKQAIEMAQIYSGLLNSTIEAFGTIISNNLNSIMKFLAGITIVISIPTMIASFMGMNVPLGVFSSSEGSFLILLIFSLVISLIIAYVLKKKNML